MSLQQQVAPTTTPASLTVSSAQRLVLVDADETARGVLSHTLVRLGYRVEAVVSLVQARQRLEQLGADGLVISSAAVEANGLLAWLRSVPSLQSLPVIFAAPVDDAHIAALAELVSIDVVVRKPAFARDVAALTRWALARGVGQTVTFQRNLDAPLHVVRGLVAAGATATVRLAQGRGLLTLEAGLVVRCSLGTHWGVDALARALAVTQGPYEVSVSAMAPATDSRQMFKELLHIVAPRLTRFQAATKRGLPLDGLYAVDFRKLAEALPTLPEDAARLVRLFDGTRTLLDVACDSTLNEALTLDVAERLFTMGVITIPANLGPTRMPALFESAQATASMAALFNMPTSAIAAATEESVTDWALVEQGVERWETQPSAEALTQGLPEELTRQLDAFDPPLASDAPTWSRRSLTPAIDMPAVLLPVSTLPTAASVESLPAANSEPNEASVEAAFFEQQQSTVESAEARKPFKRTLGLVLGLAVAALALSLVVELSRRPVVAAESEVVTGRVGPVEEMAPAIALQVADVEPSAPIELEAPPATVSPPAVVDVAGLLAAGLKAQAQEKYQLAAAAFEQVVEAEPTNVKAWMELGLARHEAGDKAGATRAVDTIIALNPSYARVHMLLAAMHFEGGRAAQAKQALQMYLSLEPNGPHAAEARALLR